MRTFKLAGLLAVSLLAAAPTVRAADKVRTDRTPTDDAVDRINGRAEKADRKVTRQARKGQRKVRTGAKKAGDATGRGLEKTGDKINEGGGKLRDKAR